MDLKEKILVLNEEIKKSMRLNSEELKDSSEISKLTDVVLSLNNQTNQNQKSKLKTFLQKQRNNSNTQIFKTYNRDKDICSDCSDSKYYAYIYDLDTEEEISLEDEYFEINNIYLYELYKISLENNLKFICNRCHNKKDFLKSLK